METKAKIATLTFVVAIILSALALTLSPAGASSNFFWNNDDEFKAKSLIKTEVKNKNIAKVDTNTTQTAVSGSVNVYGTDDLTGGAGTGGAKNANSAGAAISATNAGASSVPALPPVSIPSPSSFSAFDDVTLKSKVITHVSNKNYVDVDTNTTQTAVSGDVNVACADDVSGPLTTGMASNENMVNTVISLSN